MNLGRVLSCQSKIDVYNCSRPVFCLSTHVASCTDALLLSSSIIPPLATATSVWLCRLPFRISESVLFPPSHHPSLLRQACSPWRASHPRLLGCSGIRIRVGSCALESHYPLGKGSRFRGHRRYRCTSSPSLRLLLCSSWEKRGAFGFSEHRSRVAMHYMWR